MATVSIEVSPEDMAAVSKIMEARGLTKNEALVRVAHTGVGRELALIKYGKPGKPGKRPAKATSKPVAKAKPAKPAKAAAKASSKPSKPVKAVAKPAKVAPAIIDDLN